MNERPLPGTLRATGGLDVLDHRPKPGAPRPYRFPVFDRTVLPNGMAILSAHLPGRPLLAAQVILEGGAGSEPAGRGGVTSLAAEALTEGTTERDALEFIEASERLGASIQASAGWETLTTSLEVPRRRFEAAIALLAEAVLSPAFPEREIERLRDERLNDLLQARAEPRRRAEHAFIETIYAPRSPYSRPIAGTESTVRDLDRDAVVERYEALLDPATATFVVAGDLAGLHVTDLVSAAFAAWVPRSGREPAGRSPERGSAADATPHPDGPRTVLIDRPGSPQTEVRIGHVGLPRRIPDYHAVVVMSAILGGLFNSRLQRLLREERGYTYGVGASFDLRRAAGPFSVRTAVQTEVTAPAVMDALGELRRIREAPPTAEELDAARDYLIGVFPLRFEVPAQVVGAIGGIVVFGLPDDELDRYRPAIAAVTADDVLAAAEHVDAGRASVVLVGDAERVEPELVAAGLGPVTVIHDELPGAAGPGGS